MVTKINKIEYLRRINLLTQKEVAKYCGISQQQYYKIEKGKTRLTVDMALKLKNIFKLKSIDELVEGVA